MIVRRELILSGAAAVLATIRPRHEAGQWKIDDIKGAVDGSPWSVRALLVDSLKY